MPFCKGCRHEVGDAEFNYDGKLHKTCNRCRGKPVANQSNYEIGAGGSQVQQDIQQGQADINTLQPQYYVCTQCFQTLPALNFGNNGGINPICLICYNANNQPGSVSAYLQQIDGISNDPWTCSCVATPRSCKNTVDCKGTSPTQDGACQPCQNNGCPRQA